MHPYQQPNMSTASMPQIPLGQNSIPMGQNSIPMGQNQMQMTPNNFGNSTASLPQLPQSLAGGFSSGGTNFSQMANYSPQPAQNWQGWQMPGGAAAGGMPSFQGNNIPYVSPSGGNDTQSGKAKFTLDGKLINSGMNIPTNSTPNWTSMYPGNNAGAVPMSNVLPVGNYPYNLPRN